MIDTLKICLATSIIKAENTLDIRPAADMPFGAFDLVYDTGEVRTVTKVKYRGTTFELYSHNGNIYVLIHSLPQYLAGGRYSIEPLTQETAIVAFQQLQVELDQIGIVTDINQARIIRIDLWANAATDHSYLDFKALFNTLYFARQKRIDYPGYLAIKNTQRTDVFYDKRARMEEVGADTAGLPPQLIRYEYRLKKPEAVRSLRIRTVGELITNWDQVRAQLIARIGTVLRHDQELPGVVDLSDMASLVGTRVNAQRALFAREVLARTGNLDELRKILKQRQATRKQISRFVEVVLEGLEYPLASERVTINALKQELYTKLIEGLGEEDRQN